MKPTDIICRTIAYLDSQGNYTPGQDLHFFRDGLPIRSLYKFAVWINYQLTHRGFALIQVEGSNLTIQLVKFTDIPKSAYRSPGTHIYFELK